MAAFFFRGAGAGTTEDDDSVAEVDIDTLKRSFPEVAFGTDMGGRDVWAVDLLSSCRCGC